MTVEFPEPPEYTLCITRDVDTSLWVGDLRGAHELFVPLFVRARTIEALYASASEYGTRNRCRVATFIDLPSETLWYLMKAVVGKGSEWVDLLKTALGDLGLEPCDVEYFVEHAASLATFTTKKQPNATKPPTEDPAR